MLEIFSATKKLKEIDSARARSTSALYGHASGEGEEDDEEGGFLSRISLRKNKSRSEDSSNSGKSSSRNSLNSTESQEHFKEGLKGRRSSVENSEPSVDLEAVAKTEALNTDAAKFKISVRPKGRKGSRQSRKSRQKVASNLPCLNEEQQTFTSPSLNKDDVEEIPPKVETEIFPPKEEITEPVAKKKREQRIPLEDLPPKPRPKSTPVTIHSTEETHQISNTVIATPTKNDSSKHSKEPFSDEVNTVATSSKMTVDSPTKTTTKVVSEPAKQSLAPKLKSFEQTSSAANEIAGSGIDVTQNNTNRLSALFEAKSVAASHVDPGTTVKIEVIAKDDSSEQAKRRNVWQ
ncbi:unnamed protein product [Acanthosepion pharaonis]|uniref:Uncharacterized protein n=1 Tax=Acanthosepion pharaonis TaxID=158019 RepID=A0A812D4W8_ACAPH|nr:unnamed protein product [Sepia pharaonis]